MKDLKMMDPLPNVPPPSLNSLSSSVLNGASCKHSNRHPQLVRGDESFKKQDSVFVNAEEIKDLLEFFSKTTYKARDTQPKVQHMMERCMQLFGIDYKYSVLPNSMGELSTNYPSSLIILESEKDLQTPTQSPISSPSRDNLGGVFSSCSYLANPVSSSKIGLSSSWKLNAVQESVLELPKLKDLCSRARFARCRARFPVPVILYNQKHICRSATLSGGPEIYGRSSFDYFFSGGVMEPDGGGNDEELLSEAQNQSDWQLFDRVRSQDIRLLKTFQVETIVDLMVEKKKVKFGMNVTSSEKVDKENRYAEFNIVSLPYPGCEFFRQYRDNGYNAEELVFEWNQGHVDAHICVPSDPTAASLNLDWSHYRDWDLVLLSQNYLKLLLGYIHDRESGLLIHCISGWDRTPLFISILRLSLWADGVIHKSLDADQILYLTLAYDWLLFGHNLEDRLSKGEEIMFFCFNFLKYIGDPEFSVNQKSKPSKPSEFSNVRNDSDVHLEGVLLDHEGSHTSPEGSNWSLSSCDSTPSTKSQENAPTYFQVSNDSWEDAQPQNQRSDNGSDRSLIHILSQPTLTANGSITSSCIITASMMDSTTTTPTSSLGGFTKSHSPSILQPVLSPIPSAAITSAPRSTGSILHETPNKLTSCANGNSRSPHSPPRTSPVAVPLPNRLHCYSHTRHDSNSSASIGSWQLVTGNGSMKETVFSSVPESYPLHSQLSRLSTNQGYLELEGSESTQSSCTLVGELTPPVTVESKLSLLHMQLATTEQCVEDDRPDLMHFEEEIGLALEESIIIGNDNSQTGQIPSPDCLNLMSSSQDESTTPASTTPTKEHEGDGDVDVVDGVTHFPKDNNNADSVINPEARIERLDKVRTRFYSLYDMSIRSSFPVNLKTASASSGLGFLIGNIATKVGIRSSVHRTTHV